MRNKSKKDLSENKNSRQSESSLVLINDDVNTFDFVIDSLSEVLGFERIQAEQCALIVHLKQQYELKKGHKSDLIIYRDQLIGKGLKAKIIN